MNGIGNQNDSRSTMELDLEIDEEELKPVKKNGSSYGYAIQNDLIQLLR